MYAHVHDGVPKRHRRTVRKSTEGHFGKKHGKVRKDTCTEKYGRSYAWQIDQQCDQALKIRKSTEGCVRICLYLGSHPQDTSRCCKPVFVQVCSSGCHVLIQCLHECLTRCWSRKACTKKLSSPMGTRTPPHKRSKQMSCVCMYIYIYI